jgi:signal transduction histidine kinase
LFIETPFGGASLPVELRHLACQWDELTAEIQRAAQLLPETFPFAEQQRLTQFAWTNYRDDELHAYRSLLLPLLRDLPERRIATIFSLIARRYDGPVAIWIAGNDEVSGVGVAAAMLQTGVFHGSQRAFERMLDPSLRSSTELRTASGEFVGRIYTAEPVNFGDWPEIIAAALEPERTIGRLQGAVAELEATARENVGRLDEVLRTRLRAMIGEFASGAGHEINNPLATIRGYAQRLLVGEVDPDRRQMLKRIDEQADRIHRMIEDLHLIGRPGTPRLEPVRLATVLERAAAAAARRRPEANLTLEPLDPAWHIAGNEADLVRLFTEILANARYAAGPDGRVHIRASTPADGKVAVTVADSGPGFTEIDRQCALGPFYSGRSAGRGLGMGLAVAARIAEDHGGAIQFAAEPTNAVIVYLTLCDESRSHCNSAAGRTAA